MVQLLALAGLVVGFESWMDGLADRAELGARLAHIQFTPAELPAEAGPLRLAGAWKLTSDDARFGGVSALAIDGGRLLALTDSGVLFSFPKPTGARHAAAAFELPGGPGDGRFKSARDSEAMVRDPAWRGWWVAFENRHSVWLFDPAFRHGQLRIDFGRGRWRQNVGIEGLAVSQDGLLAFPEMGRTVINLRKGGREHPIADPRGRVSDAAELPDGRLAVILRRPSPIGFRNALGILGRAGNGFRFVAVTELPFRPLDNVEAVAAEQLAGGTMRLWLMTDDNYHAPLRTLLVAFDLPPKRPAD